jgi:hypothetical protein
MLDGVTDKRVLELTGSRAFTNGNVFLSYQPST